MEGLTPPDPAVDRARRNADFRSHALRVVAQFASAGTEFTATDVRTAHPDLVAPHGNLWGQVFSEARRNGLIRSVGHVRSTRRPRHAGIHAVWVGARVTQG